MQSSISFAASMDGVAWAKHPGNPVLAAGALDSQALSPAVLFDGNEYHMWYYGAFSGRVGLSYATAPWSIPKAAFSATHAEAFDGEPVSFDAAAAVSPNGEIASYRWDFGDGATAEGATISHAYARPGHYTVTLTAIDAAGKEGSVARAIDVRLRRGDISPWQGQDVGEHELPSGARFEGSAEAGLIRLHTRGGDIGLRADAFQLVSRELQGDFTLTARVEAREATSAAGKVGLMVREGADPEARHAAIVLQGAPGSRRLRWIRRLTRGGTSLASAGPAVPAEASPWLRLERRGSVVSAFTLEGDAWQPVGEPVAFDPPLGALLHAGVAAAAGQSGAEGGHQDLLASIGGLEVTQGIGPFLRGDCNGDGEVEGQVTDAVFLLAYSFTGGAAPACLAACDSNGDGATDISDAVHLLGFNFLGGSAPSAPFPLCGPSETESDRALGCATSLASCQ